LRACGEDNAGNRSGFSALKSLVQSALCALCVLVWQSALAAVHYVDVNSTNATPPYTNWTTAATIIQDAVDAAVAGDEIVVTNGTYATGGRAIAGDSTMNRVAVEKPLDVRSVNGAQFTVIYGSVPLPYDRSVIRCAYVTNGASLSGFTLTNGFLYQRYSGSAYGAGAYGGTLNNCILSGNEIDVNSQQSGETAYAYGGGAYGSTLNNCTLSGNGASANYLPSSGQTYLYAYGGGAYNCSLNNCTLVGNGVGASGYSAEQGFARSAGGGAYLCSLRNCTLVNNTAYAPSGGIGCADYYSEPFNCIAWHNYSLSDLDPAPECEDCDSPDPLFVDTNGWANLRLQSNSPCINAGNNAFAPAGPDLDGNPRIVGGTVDIGAYEFQTPVSKISYAWLQFYGLPINAATDTADPDGDGVDNYHEWLAGTNPTNRFSSPAQLTIVPSGVPPSAIILTWSTNAVGFTLQSATDLTSTALWTTNLPGPVVIGGQNVVANLVSGAHQFYRLVH
jgi:hypothetical protein